PARPGPAALPGHARLDRAPSRRTVRAAGRPRADHVVVQGAPRPVGQRGVVGLRRDGAGTRGDAMNDLATATYAHLAAIAARGRMPSDYEIATTHLHYYLGRGFEVAMPIGDWYRRFQTESPLACDDWDRFADPRQSTYGSYVAAQQAK